MTELSNKDWLDLVFGVSKEIRIYCPNDTKDIFGNYICKDHQFGYVISIDNISQNVVRCYSCGREYLQVCHTEKTDKYIREALHRVKGE